METQFIVASPETLRKLCISKKLPRQKLRSNFGILCDVPSFSMFNVNPKSKHIDLQSSIGVKHIGESTLLANSFS